EAKEAKIKAYDEAVKEFEAASAELKEVTSEKDKVLADPNSTPAQKEAAWNKVAETIKKLGEKGDAEIKAWEEAQADPNKLPPNVSRPSLSNACLQAMQKAAAFLAECNRSGWKSPGCATLKARMHNCPDPALIYPNPAD